MSKVWIPIARIGRPKGLKGEFFCDLFNADSDLLEHLETIVIGNSSPRKVERCYFNGKRWIVKLEGIDTVEDAQKLTHETMNVNRENFPALPSGQYYHIDLIGLKVLDEEGVEIGSVKHVYTTPTNDVIEIEKGEELFTCALIKDFLVEISLEKGVIYVKKGGIVHAF